MYTKNLARILGLLCQNSDVSYSAPQELEQRFESLRSYDRLPRGRARREEKLSGEHIAAAVFGLVPMHPGWAGHVAIILEGLRPVGGTEASFFMAETLSDVIVTLLADEGARKDFIRMTLTMAETGMNSHGGAEIMYRRNGEKRRGYFLPKGAVSLLSPGREGDFDPDRDRMNAPTSARCRLRKSSFGGWPGNARWPSASPRRLKATAPSTIPRKPNRNVTVSSAYATARASSISAWIIRSLGPRRKGSSHSISTSWCSCPRPRKTCNRSTSI